MSVYREPSLPPSSGLAGARIPEEHDWQPRALSLADAVVLDAKITAFAARLAEGASCALPFWYDVANERSYRLPAQRAALESELANLLRARAIGMPLAEYLARRRAREC